MLKFIVLMMLLSAHLHANEGCTFQMYYDLGKNGEAALEKKGYKHVHGFQVPDFEFTFQGSERITKSYRNPTFKMVKANVLITDIRSGKQFSTTQKKSAGMAPWYVAQRLHRKMARQVPTCTELREYFLTH